MENTTNATAKPNLNQDTRSFPAKCSKCNKECTVPFRPDPTKKVYCRECYAEIRKTQPRKF